MESTVDRPDPFRFDALDGIGDQLGVRMLDGRIEVGGDDEPLAGRPASIIRIPSDSASTTALEKPLANISEMSSWRVVITAGSSLKTRVSSSV